jgi:hypothetical protein
VAATTNPQPQLAYVVAVLGKTVKIDTSLSAVLTDLLQTTVLPPSSTGASSSGTIPAALSAILQQAQTDYNNAKAALAAGNLAAFQQDITAMDQQLSQAQQVLGAAPSATTSTSTTTTTTAPKPHPGRSGSGSTTSTTGPTTRSTTSTTSPPSTEPQGGSTTTSSVASASPASR